MERDAYIDRNDNILYFSQCEKIQNKA
jgi:hypothetical protein